MIELPICNNLITNKISFKSHKNNIGEPSKKGMTTGDKLMIGATALAAATVAGIMAAKVLKKGRLIENTSQRIEDILVKTDKSPHDMNQEELLDWGKKQILRVKEVFNKDEKRTHIKYGNPDRGMAVHITKEKNGVSFSISEPEDALSRGKDSLKLYKNANITLDSSKNIMDVETAYVTFTDFWGTDPIITNKVSGIIC